MEYLVNSARNRVSRKTRTVVARIVLFLLLSVGASDADVDAAVDDRDREVSSRLHDTPANVHPSENRPRELSFECSNLPTLQIPPTLS